MISDNIVNGEGRSGIEFSMYIDAFSRISSNRVESLLDQTGESALVQGGHKQQGSFSGLAESPSAIDKFAISQGGDCATVEDDLAPLEPAANVFMPIKED